MHCTPDVIYSFETNIRIPKVVFGYSNLFEPYTYYSFIRYITCMYLRCNKEIEQIGNKEANEYHNSTVNLGTTFQYDHIKAAKPNVGSFQTHQHLITS